MNFKIGFPGLLAIVFIVLQLCHVINWSWWWVLAPIWISGVIGIVVLLAIFAFALVVTWGKSK